MTTENTDITSALDSDQAQLDAVQEAPGSQPVPADAVTDEIRALKGLIQSQNQQVAGLQSKVDKGLNAIRRDTEESQRRQQEYAVQQYLEQVPEEHRAAFQQMAQQNLQLQQQLSQTQYQEPAQAQQQQAPSGEWEQIYSIPRSMGIDPQTPGIDYQAFTDPGLTEEQRRDRFFTSIKTVMAAPTAPAPTPDAQEGRPQQDVQNPPTGGTPAGGVSGSLRSIEQIERAYIEDKLPFDEYKKRLAEAGQR